jgi:predicted phage terminase large subunit-like protein
MYWSYLSTIAPARLPSRRLHRHGSDLVALLFDPDQLEPAHLHVIDGLTNASRSLGPRPRRTHVGLLVSLVQSLRAETRLPILQVKPSGDKVARANAVTPLIESGRVHLPEAAPWLGDFMDEANGFPAAPHDDLIDALSQALSYLRRTDPI